MKNLPFLASVALKYCRIIFLALFFEKALGLAKFVEFSATFDEFFGFEWRVKLWCGEKEWPSEIGNKSLWQ